MPPTGRGRWWPTIGRTAVLAVSLSGALPAAAQQRMVLVVHAGRGDAPASIVADQTMRRALQRRFAEHVDYYSEYIDLPRFPDPSYEPALSDHLRRKYEHHRFDLIVAPTDPSLEFLRRFGAELFPGAPLVFASEVGASAPPGASGVTFRLEFDRTLRLVSALQPAVKHVYVVSGASAADRRYEEIARAQFRAYESRFEFTYLSGLSMAELQARVGRLPQDAVVYPLSIYEDGAGERFVVMDAVERTYAAASVPGYTWLSLAIDNGAIGGDMVSLERLYDALVRIALRVLEGERVEDIPVVHIDPYVVEVDWRELARRGIDERRVPSGAAVLFRPPSLWEERKGLVIGTTAVIAFQTLLTAGLLVQRVRRRRAEDALRESYQQNRDLAGRLITAQEAERTRIARELHDDVGQRVASLSMEIGMLKRRLAGAVPGADEDIAALQRETHNLSRDLRVLSHDLHPGVIEHLGLAEALRARGDEVAGEAGLAVQVDVGRDLGSVPAEAALCLYRVAQEALRNVVSHAHASTVRVSLARQNGRLSMIIVDDGRGFDRGAATTPRGLGLVSLDERVRILRGEFDVRSSAAGTTVSVTLPIG